MSTTTPVLQLDDHRSRRDRRLRRTLALLDFDARRARLASQLADLLGRVGGDRAVLAWVDEFDPVAPRAHIVVDLLRDRPRRRLELAPLLEAWDRGVPGILDLPEVPRAGRSTPGSMAVVSIGSDGRRAWFALVEGAHARAALPAPLIDELAFRSGEIAGVVLHPEHGAAFAAWSAVGGGRRPDDAPSEERCTVRFMVLRFLRAVLADDLVMDPETLDERVEFLREELEPWRNDPEGAVWVRILDAGAGGRVDDLRSACLELGARTAEVGELEAAAEAYRSAYELAVALGDIGNAGRAAQQLGRTHRNSGSWDESEAWYSTAVDLARVSEDLEAEALAVDGWANTLRVKGAFPKARRRLVRALDLAERSGSGYALGGVHQSFLSLEAQSENYDRAVLHGLAAVEAYETPRHQVRALVSLAATFVEVNRVDAAETAYRICVDHCDEAYFRLFALDGFAHTAALRGDVETYLERQEAVDQEDWRVGGPDFEAQALLGRGAAWERLGDVSNARRWFSSALACAERHGLSQILFAAQDGLARLEDAEKTGARQSRIVSSEDSEEILGRLDRLDRRLASAAP